MRGRNGAVVFQLQQKLRDAPVRLQKGHGVHLCGKHADGLRQIGQQVHGELRFPPDADEKAWACDRDDFGFLQRFRGRDARHSVEKGGFAENAAAVQQRERFFHPAFGAEKDFDFSALQVVELPGVGALPVDHFVFCINAGRDGFFQHIPPVRRMRVHGDSSPFPGVRSAAGAAFGIGCKYSINCNMCYIVCKAPVR